MPRQVQCREQFAAALARGLGANLPEEPRRLLAKEVWEWLNEAPPPPFPSLPY